MTKKFLKLRRIINERSSIEDLARELGREPPYLYGRLQGKQTFSLTDIYSIISRLDIPAEQIPEYFPPNGEEPGKQWQRCVPISSYQSRLLAAYDKCPHKDAVDLLLNIHRRKEQDDD